MSMPRPSAKKPARRNGLASVIAVALFDMASGAVSLWAALYLRYQLEPRDPPEDLILQAVSVFALSCAVVFFLYGLHRGVWRYTALNDAARIVRACVVANLAFLPVLFLINRLDGFPRTSILIELPLLLVLLIGARMTVAAWRRQGLRAALQFEDRRKPPAILVGDEDDLDEALRELSRRNGASPFRPRALIAVNSDLSGRSIRGVPVTGGLDSLPAVYRRVEEAEADPPRIVLASTQADVRLVNDLIRIAASLGAKLSRARPANGPDAFSPIEAADLLNRPPRAPDLTPARPLIEGKRVLVTGAGGTIGAQLVRLAADLKPEKLLLLDASEANLYKIDMELREMRSGLRWRSILGDVRDGDRLDQIFAEETPQVVLHAAALKHVPMSEDNPSEAALTNVLGTVRTIEAAREHGAQIVALISTDKAVDPSNVMGATKRAAELHARTQTNGGSKTRICVVRFGNVLGSTGSVVPLFERQIETGIPVTVTDPEATRYFMTVEEASGLVLSAAAQTAADAGLDGALYVFDMGQPVPILRLARQLLRLRGIDPDAPGSISVIGLRPGEKRHEALTYDFEQTRPTAIDGVWSVDGPPPDSTQVETAIQTLIEAARKRDTQGVRASLKAVCEIHSEVTAD